MRIGFFGDGPWAHLALEKICAHDNFKVAYIVARYDTQDSFLKNKAVELGIPFFAFPNVNDLDVISKLASYSVDINVSMSFNQILRKAILKSAKMGFVNCHAGLLPFYRGRNILNWALINDEKEFGVTVHYIDEGIDTGDIILQQKMDILDNDDYGVILRKAYILCAETLDKALCMINNGEVSAIPQSSIHPVGFYCGRRQVGDEYLDWNWSSRRIYNFVRSITRPGPGARVICDNQEYIVWGVELIINAPNYICTVGEIVGRDKYGITVKTGDATIRLTQVSLATGSDGIIGFLQYFKIGNRFVNYDTWQLSVVREEIKKLQQQIVHMATGRQ